MRQIGHLPNAAQAQLFRDFLYARGIENQIERDGDASWIVWVSSEEQLEAAREMLERFRRDPDSPEFERAAASAEQLRAREAGEDAAYRKRFFNRDKVFPGSRGFSGGILTYLLIVACVVVGLYSKLGQDPSLLRYLFISVQDGGGFLPEVRAGEAWRLFTPVLIHFGPVHLLFNMIWLFQLGSMIEGRQGHLPFGVLVLSLAVGSNLTQYVIYHQPLFGGMSGVVYGLFGYVWLRGRFDPASGLFIDKQTIILMIAWFFAGFTGLIGPIANGAHGGGLVLGAIWGLLSALAARR